MMDYYTLHLLGLAADVSPGGMSWWIDKTAGGHTEWCVEQEAPARTVQVHSGPTLADALAALLTDLGVEVPERPSAERMAKEADYLDDVSWSIKDHLQGLYAREPLTVLAMLEGGDS